ncbi:unnamed protein product, partial [marine sediment metagenome]
MDVSGKIKNGSTAMGRKLLKAFPVLKRLQGVAKGKQTGLLIRFDTFLKHLPERPLGNFFYKFFTTMEWKWLKNYRGQFITKGFLRRFLQVERDMLLFNVTGDMMARDDVKKESKEIILNWVIGQIQFGARTWSSRANITLAKRIAFGAGVTMGASTMGSIVMNMAWADANVLQNECMATILRRSAGNPVYATLISEPKGRVFEAFRLVAERALDK